MKILSCRRTRCIFSNKKTCASACAIVYSAIRNAKIWNAVALVWSSQIALSRAAYICFECVARRVYHPTAAAKVIIRCVLITGGKVGPAAAAHHIHFCPEKVKIQEQQANGRSGQTLFFVPPRLFYEASPVILNAHYPHKEIWIILLSSSERRIFLFSVCIGRRRPGQLLAHVSADRERTCQKRVVPRER